MAAQNMVSASLSAEIKAEVLKGIADTRKKLDFLLTLQTEDVTGMFKAGKELVPFLEACHEVANTHPEILPQIFDKAEYDRDYQLARDLAPLADAVYQLWEAINHTLTAARSDALVSSLDVYSAAKLNQDKVPGLNSVVVHLASFFKRPANGGSAKKAKRPL